MCTSDVNYLLLIICCIFFSYSLKKGASSVTYGVKWADDVISY